MTDKRSFWAEVLSKGATVKVRNVMNPLLWLNAVTVPALLVGAYLFKEAAVLAAPMILGAVAIPIWTMTEYRHFARNDPTRLQSEEYLIEQQRLMMESKGERTPIDVATLASIGNPEFKQISDFYTSAGAEDE